jgi:cyanophycinase
VTERDSGRQMLIGGSGPEGMERRLIQRIVELAGGAEAARVVVVPTASEQRAATIERYENAFQLEEVEHIEVLDIRTHKHADKAETLRVLGEATAVVFTGGDQLRLLSILAGTRFVAELRRLNREGLVVAGSSAGAMALGDPVIVRGEPTAFFEAGAIHQAPGLAVLEGVTVDTHFVARGRLGRLVAVVAGHPDTIGLGIEEGCGVVVSSAGVATVMGAGVVCIVDAVGAEPRLAGPGRALSVSDLKLHILADGDAYDLRARRVVRG